MNLLALVLCAGAGLVGLVWVYLRPSHLWWWSVVSAVGLEVIHHWYAGIGQYFPWVGGFIGAFLALYPKRREIWRELSAGSGWAPLLYALYVLVVGISAVLSVNRGVSIRYLVGVPAVLAVTNGFLPWMINRKTLSVEGVLKAMAWAGLLMTVTAGTAAAVFHSGFPVPVGRRILLAWQWPFANKNTLGVLLTFATPAAFALFLRRGTSLAARGGWLLATLVLVAGVGMSYARSAWVATAVGLVALLVTRYGKRGVITVLVLFPLGVTGLVAKTGLHRWQLLWDKGLNGRSVLWQAGVKVLEHHPLFGVGPGNSPQAIAPFLPAAYVGLTPHDTLLRTAVELGGIGAAIWVLIVVGALVRTLARAFGSWAHSAVFALILASLAQQMVESLFIGGVSFGDFFFTTLAGLAWWMPAAVAYGRRQYGVSR